jgi:hypothetical protein
VLIFPLAALTILRGDVSVLEQERTAALLAVL